MSEQRTATEDGTDTRQLLATVEEQWSPAYKSSMASEPTATP